MEEYRNISEKKKEAIVHSVIFSREPLDADGVGQGGTFKKAFVAMNFLPGLWRSPAVFILTIWLNSRRCGRNTLKTFIRVRFNFAAGVGS